MSIMRAHFPCDRARLVPRPWIVIPEIVVIQPDRVVVALTGEAHAAGPQCCLQSFFLFHHSIADFESFPLNRDANFSASSQEK